VARGRRRQGDERIISNQLPEYLADVQPWRSAELAKTRELVSKRALRVSATVLSSTLLSQPSGSGLARRPRSPRTVSIARLSNSTTGSGYDWN